MTALIEAEWCLDCEHPSFIHRSDATAVCMLCLCEGLHLDIGECTSECRGE